MKQTCRVIRAAAPLPGRYCCVTASHSRLQWPAFRTADAGHGPRVHELRHTCAVYSLTAKVDQGADVNWALPTLATYRGHASAAAPPL
jgi:integrase